MQALERQDLIDFYSRPLPDDINECVENLVSNLANLNKFNTLVFWNTGRVINYFLETDHENVLDEVSERTGYEKRTLYYALAVYQKIPDVTTIVTLTEKGLKWTDIKKLSALKTDVCSEVLADAEEADAEAVRESIDEKKEETKTPKTEKPSATIKKMFTQGGKYLDTLHAQYNKLDNIVTIRQNPELTTDAEYDKVEDMAVDAKQKLEEIQAMVIESIKDLDEKIINPNIEGIG